MVKAMPLYAGVEHLEKEGQWVQWGGERLFTDGFTRMPDHKARFTPVELPEIKIPPGWFYLTTRRGKQFNSMSFGQKDFLMGSDDRHHVLISPEDAGSFGIGDGAGILLRSDVGEWTGIARHAPMKSRNLQAYWPETNVLITRRFDPVSGEPDYNCLVTIAPVGRAGSVGEPARVTERRAGRAQVVAGAG
jgi:anaerobic selenocysteine-containing dehydrogenase